MRRYRCWTTAGSVQRLARHLPSRPFCRVSGADSVREIRTAARYVRHLPRSASIRLRDDQFRQTLNIRKSRSLRRQFQHLRAGLLRHHQP